MVATGVGAAQKPARTFYVWMAGACVLIAFGGFIPTYWAKLVTGGFGGAPVLHVHGALFFTWTLYFFAQTSLVATGKTPDHRTWGMAGISLATAMGFTVVLAVINSIKAAERIGMGDQARMFSIVSLGALVLFATLFTLAIVNIRRPEAHKRFMIIAMVPLMQAAMARLFQTALAPDAVGPPPVFVSVPPGLVVDLLIVALALHDWRTLKKVHPVTLYAGGAAIALQLLNVPIGASAAWMSIARAVESLAG